MVNEEGITTIIAVSIIAGNEDGAKFTWIFEKFKLIFKAPPSVIITDSCSKIAMGITNQFPGVKHFLCIWHLSRNVETHFFKIISKLKWKDLQDKFWSLAMKSDSSTIISFDLEFNDFYDFLVTSTSEYKDNNKKNIDIAKSEEIIERALAWVKSIVWGKRELYAYRFTWSTFTAGCHSTQRSESLHSAVKSKVITNRLNLVDVFSSIVNFQINADKRNDIAQEISLKRRKEVISGSLLATVKTGNYSKYIWKQFNEQYDQSHGYSCCEVIGEDSQPLGYNVWRNNVANPIIHRVTLCGNCSCQFRTSYDISCRHVIRVSETKQNVDSNGKPNVIGGAIGLYWLRNRISIDDTGRNVTRSVTDADSKERNILDLRSLCNTVIDAISNSTEKCSMLKSQLTQYIKHLPSEADTLNDTSICVSLPERSVRDTSAKRHQPYVEQFHKRGPYKKKKTIPESK